MPVNLGLCSLHLPSTANHGNWPLSGGPLSGLEVRAGQGWGRHRRSVSSETFRQHGDYPLNIPEAWLALAPTASVSN